ncbi:MAG: biotin synthase [Desulfurococcaceae archaeon]
MKLKAFIPYKLYKPLSITGSWCSLNCRFCSRKYLENMVFANPENFSNVVHDLYYNGVRGILVSGGFRPDATLPIEPYIDSICIVKKKLDIVISAHLGLVEDRNVLASLKNCIDVVDYEFTLSSFIINEVRGLKFGKERYIKALNLMLEEGLHVIPHVFVWHPRIKTDELSGELRTLLEMGVHEAALLVFIDNEYRGYREKIAEIVLRNIELARSVFPGKLYMGCMRPGWLKPLLDPLIIERNLVDRVVNPHHTLLRERSNIVIYDACCSVPEHLLNRFQLTYINH